MSGLGGGFGFSQPFQFGFGQPQQQHPQTQQQHPQQTQTQPPIFGAPQFSNLTDTSTPAPMGTLFGGVSSNVNPSDNLFGTPPSAHQQQMQPNPPSQFGSGPVFGVQQQPILGGIPGSFGQQQASSAGTYNPFGASPGLSFGVVSHSGSPFGGGGGGGGGPTMTFPRPLIQQHPSQSLSSVHNPFAMNSSMFPTSAAPMMSFGVSSNVADDSEMINSGSNSPVPTAWNNSLFSPGLPQPEVAMKDQEKPPPLSNLPFGTPVDTGKQTFSEAPWSANKSMTTSVPNPFQSIVSAPATASGSISPVMTDASSFLSSSDTNKDKTAPSSEASRLLELKAKIEEKKKRLELKMRIEMQGNRQPKANEAARNAPGGKSSPVPSVRDEKDVATSAMAERNSLRFANSSANHQDTKSLLPTDMQDQAPIDYSALRQAPTDALDLGSAKSLVGTCVHMCPDEELRRRQQEGDIQLLELVRPGDLHPEEWTLRDTVVKRFRRSAADYKLDVPEWVRPPDGKYNIMLFIVVILSSPTMPFLFWQFSNEFVVILKNGSWSGIDKVLI